MKVELYRTLNGKWSAHFIPMDRAEGILLGCLHSEVDSLMIEGVTIPGPFGGESVLEMNLVGTPKAPR